MRATLGVTLLAALARGSIDAQVTAAARTRQKRAPVDSAFSTRSSANNAGIPPRIVSNGDLHAILLPIKEQSRGWRAGRRQLLVEEGSGGGATALL